MCGISGVVSSNSTARTLDCRNMVNLGKHRGPDGSRMSLAIGQSFREYDSDEDLLSSCVVGHSRLTILDLSEASSQPFTSSDGRYSLVFNGEIYNYIELREELTYLGVTFNSTGDTEVLMNVLIEWGIDGISKLRGMFAFAFVDLKEETVLLARDRYGIKPLHIFTDQSNLYFASEIKQFVELPTWNPTVNEKVALQFLLYGVTDHGKNTMFSSVQRVLPGHFIKVKFDQIHLMTQIAWYSEPDLMEIGSYQQACDRYAEAFQDSISVHLRSDVSIGSCLSGGLDSSAIVGVANSLISNNEFHTFTATSELESINEEKYVRAVVEFNSCSPHFVQPTVNRLLEEMDLLTWHQDEPFGGTSIFAQWCVFKLAHDSGIKVLLDGQGADEQLAGYNSFLYTYLSSLLRKLKLLSFIREFRELTTSKRITSAEFFQFLFYQTFPEKLVRTIGRRLGVASQNGGGWIDQEVVDRNLANDPFKNHGKVPKDVKNLSKQMIEFSNLPMLLRFEDRNSMAHGIESRVPFVDPKVMNVTNQIQDHHLIDGVYTKRVLRDGLANYLPDVVRLRKDKIGFQTAEEIWMKNKPEEFKSLVRDSVQRCPTFFTEQTINACYELIDGRVPYSPLVWRVISFGEWVKVFRVKGC